MIADIKAYLERERERERIMSEEAAIARADWSQFFPAIGRMNIRLVCATLEAVAAVKRMEYE